MKLTKPCAGWSNLTVGKFTIHVSYLTDILEDFVEVFENFIKNDCNYYQKTPAVIRLDAEEYGDLLLIINNWETILVTDDDSRNVYFEYLSVNESMLSFAKCFLNDIYDWVYHFEIWAEDMETEEDYKKKHQEYKEKLTDIVEELEKHIK